MSEIHYISRVEYCEVRELTAMTVVKKQFALVPPAANFTRLPMVGLASVEVSDKIENKQRVFVSKLAVFLPERFEVGNKKLCFRLRTVSGEYFMLGSGDRPYSLITDRIPQYHIQVLAQLGGQIRQHLTGDLGILQRLALGNVGTPHGLINLVR